MQTYSFKLYWETEFSVYFVSSSPKSGHSTLEGAGNGLFLKSSSTGGF